MYLVFALGVWDVAVRAMLGPVGLSGAARTSWARKRLPGGVRSYAFVQAPTAVQAMDRFTREHRAGY